MKEKVSLFIISKLKYRVYKRVHSASTKLCHPRIPANDPAVRPACSILDAYQRQSNRINPTVSPFSPIKPLYFVTNNQDPNLSSSGAKASNTNTPPPYNSRSRKSSTSQSPKGNFLNNSSSKSSSSRLRQLTRLLPPWRY